MFLTFFYLDVLGWKIKIHSSYNNFSILETICFYLVYHSAPVESILYIIGIKGEINTNDNCVP